MLVVVSGVSFDDAVPGQDLLPGYRCWSWTCCSRSPHGPRCALPRAARTTPSGPSTTCWVGLASPTLAAQLTPEIETATAQGASAVPSGRRRHPDRGRQAYRRGVRWNRDTAPAGPYPPARWVGWSLATRPRAGRPRERPEDAPARGDRHRARIRVREGPPLHVLAQARGFLSVHSADLRLALPGVPSPRAAVLQPRRLGVPGARHWAAGGGVGPAVAGQGDDEGRPLPETQRPMTVTAGERCRGARPGWRQTAPTFVR